MANFNKAELKTGMLVQLTNGKWATIVRDCCCTEGTKDMYVLLDGTSWDKLDYHDDNLNYIGSWPEEFQIQKVATCDYMREIIKGIPAEKLQGFKVIWQRENPKKQQLTELVSKLQAQLKDATDELEAM